VMLISITGPPWFDTATGKPLDTAKVEAGMARERTSLDDFATFDDVDEGEACQDGAVTIASRWVLSDRPAKEEVKCRIVAQQLRATDTNNPDVFAATPTTVSQRLLIQRALERKWILHTGDVSTAFLHASLPSSAKIYIVPPPSERRVGRLWRLRKALYGLREAPRLFQEFLAATLIRHGFTRLVADPQLYEHNTTGALVSIFADDILICCAASDLQKVKEAISAEMKVKWGTTIDDMPVKYLGREWVKDGEEYVVRIPEAYWEGTLSTTDMRGCRALSTPAETGSWSKPDDSPRLDARGTTRFRSAVGRLMWTLGERPDMAYTCKELARHVQGPTELDLQRLKHLLRYVRGTTDLHLRLGNGFVGDTDSVTVFADASWASDEGRRSTTGGIAFYGGVVIAMWARTQPVVALSSCEAELLAASVAVQEGKLIQSILGELRIDAKLVVLCDSSSARQLIAKRGLGRLKHLQTRQLWLQDELKAERITILPVSSLDNIADLFTKAFPRKRHEALCSLVGLRRQ
jgi:hypothetical protein